MRDHDENHFSRRQFLLASALAGGGLILPSFATAQNSTRMPMVSATPTPQLRTGPAEVSLRIGPVLVDVTKDKTISTIGYNGQVPGPLIRLREGRPVSGAYPFDAWKQSLQRVVHGTVRNRLHRAES